MINEGGLSVIGLLGRRRCGRIGRVAVIHPDGLADCRLHVGHHDPDITLIEQRIPFLHMMLQDGFLIICDKFQVAAILFAGQEIEDTIMQPHKHGNRANGCTDSSGFFGGIEVNLLPKRPLAIPPGCPRASGL